LENENIYYYYYYNLICIINIKLSFFTFKVDDVTVDLEQIEKQDETVFNDLDSLFSIIKSTVSTSSKYLLRLVNLLTGNRSILWMKQIINFKMLYL